MLTCPAGIRVIPGLIGNPVSAFSFNLPLFTFNYPPMSILFFIIILAVLILVHEFGHFIVAKRSGIRVDEFAFGFPPRLFGIKKGETTYAFNVLPLGGYVKIYGEDPHEVEGTDRARSFSAQHRLVQSAVILAGIVFNLLLAWVLLSATFMIGISATAETAAPYPIEGERVMLVGVPEEHPAYQAGLRSGDLLVSVSDATETVMATDPESVTRFISERSGIPVEVTFLRDERTQVLSVTPKDGIAEGRGAIGVFMDNVGTLKLSFFDALTYGAVKTYEYTVLTAVGIADFLRTAIIGRADFTQVTGPVGIVGAVGDAAGLGIANLLLFTAIISVNLAVINVLPFPALDGGRLLFVAIEGITRKPIAPVVANTMNIIGFGLLMLLMIVVTYHDIARIIP